MLRNVRFSFRLSQRFLVMGKAPQKTKLTTDQHLDMETAMLSALCDMHSASLAQVGSEPIGHKAAKREDERLGYPKWMDAERVEISELQKLGTLHVVDKVPGGCTVYDTKMVHRYRDKPPANGECGRAKARLCVRNFKNDLCENVFAPVCRIETCRYLLSELAANPNWTIWHGDICNVLILHRQARKANVHSYA